MSSKKGPKYIYAQENKLYNLLLLPLWRALKNETNCVKIISFNAVRKC